MAVQQQLRPGQMRVGSLRAQQGSRSAPLLAPTAFAGPATVPIVRQVSSACSGGLLLLARRRSGAAFQHARAVRRAPQPLRTSCEAGAGAVQPAAPKNEGGSRALQWVAGGILLLSAVALAVWHSGHAPTLKDILANSVLGRSGFLASLSLIFLSEIGDKTFFIAALMAMKLGQGVAFAGTMVALSVMSVISVGIGYACKHVPALIATSAPVGEFLGIALLLYFGFKSLKEGLSADEDGDEGAGGSSSELSEAEEHVKAAEQGGKISTGSNAWTAFLQVTSLIFVAEWGDRSMLATIALGAAQSPIGVATGAIAGHAVATVIAIVGGTLASQHISERMISIVGGVCFLVFALLSALHIM